MRQDRSVVRYLKLVFYIDFGSCVAGIRTRKEASQMIHSLSSGRPWRLFVVRTAMPALHSEKRVEMMSVMRNLEVLVLLKIMQVVYISEDALDPHALHHQLTRFNLSLFQWYICLKKYSFSKKRQFICKYSIEKRL